jgi:hypothetical protein
MLSGLSHFHPKQAFQKMKAGNRAERGPRVQRYANLSIISKSFTTGSFPVAQFNSGGHYW